MYKVAYFDDTEDVCCIRILFRSCLEEECWSYIRRCGIQPLVVLDRADQVCDTSTTDLNNSAQSCCVPDADMVSSFENVEGRHAAWAMT